ncbi:MAG: adenosylmethionine decarboxylase [Betaproteobacteria bacterium]
MKGLHVVADLYNCPPGDCLVSASALRGLCLQACESARLTVLGEHFYQFDGVDALQAGGATGAVVLAESHLAVHTWPERNQVSLDVYVCNVTADNSLKAEKLYQLMIDALKPADIVVERIWRGRELPVAAIAA